MGGGSGTATDYDPNTGLWGNLYNSLLEYVISAALIFYVLTVAGVFRLRISRPEANRPYRTFGYPFVPALYILVASTILVVLFIYRPTTTWPGLLIVILGIPVYFGLRRTPHRLEVVEEPVAGTHSQQTREPRGGMECR